MPPLQRPEQQSPLAAQVLPSVLQVELSAAHLPPVQVPPQHWLFAVHAVPSEAHAGKPHAPFSHRPLQQAPFAAHSLPSETHPPSLPNGLPASPMFTPLLLPLLLLEPLLLPAPLLEPPLLLAPLLLEPLLLDVASPASPPLAAVPLLLPQERNELPLTRPTTTTAHTTRALPRRNMRRTGAGVIPGGPSPGKDSFGTRIE
jgi:hypothetical protein